MAAVNASGTIIERTCEVTGLADQSDGRRKTKRLANAGSPIFSENHHWAPETDYFPLGIQK
jgi:hypothetical protein